MSHAREIRGDDIVDWERSCRGIITGEALADSLDDDVPARLRDAIGTVFKNPLAQDRLLTCSCEG